MKNENRRFSRISIRVNAELTLEDTCHAVEEISNLSMGGCLLPLSLDPETGTPCRLKIRLDGTDEKMAIVAEGQIIRTGPNGVAVQFTRIDPDSLFHLQNIIRYNAPDADLIDFELARHPGLK